MLELLFDNLEKLSIISLIFFLYAEIHLYIPILRGILYKKQPEIIFDTPYRVNSDYLPVLLLLKDADKFPIFLEHIIISIYDKSTRTLLDTIRIDENMTINQKWFGKIYHITVNGFIGKTLEINCKGFFKINGKDLIVKNDNYPGLSHKNLTVHIDPECLPSKDGWHCGDIHCHSYYTEDQVEFGLPLFLFPEIAKPMGLSFNAVTDHSYDLDDLLGTWTKKDPNLIKFKNSRKEIEEINKKYSDYIIIPGEELTVDNGHGRYVHMLVLNNKNFIPGNADGFEGIFDNKIAYFYGKIAEIGDDSMLTASAHPMTLFPYVQRILLKRGIWNFNDKSDSLDGHQILNGKIDNAFRLGKENWIKQLLKGSRKYIYAGNDSHGNLNRFRQLRTPLFKLYEGNYQVFGECRTIVFTDISKGINQLIKNLKKGQVVISNGPFINITIKDNGNNLYHIGNQAHVDAVKQICIESKSSEFFGKIKEIKIFNGQIDNKVEKLIFAKNYQNVSNVREKIKIQELRSGHLRAEVFTEKDKFCLTNPIWLI